MKQVPLSGRVIFSDWHGEMGTNDISDIAAELRQWLAAAAYL